MTKLTCFSSAFGIWFARLLANESVFRSLLLTGCEWVRGMVTSASLKTLRLTRENYLNRQKPVGA